MQISSLLWLRIDAPRHRDKSVGVINFFCSSSDTRVSFLSQENFSCSQKIKFIFFLSILKQVSSLKPAGEDGNKAHVNKL